VVTHGRYFASQMVKIAIPKTLFADILRLIAELRPRMLRRQRKSLVCAASLKLTGEVRLDDGNFDAF